MRLISRRLGPEEELQNSPNSIRANGLAAFGVLGPYTLLANFGPSVGGIDHDAFADENADVRHAVLAVAVRGPEEHVAGFGFCAGEMLAEAGVILRLRSTRDSVVAGSADGILRESCKLSGVSLRDLNFVDSTRKEYRSSRSRRRICPCILHLQRRTQCLSEFRPRLQCRGRCSASAEGVWRHPHSTI